MDGVHDLGGKEGFGPIDVSAPDFRHDWERRQWALSKMIDAGPLVPSLDAWRHGVELMPPAVYLSVPYFEKWCLQALHLLVKAAGVTVEEVAAHVGRAPGPGVAAPGAVRDLAGALAAVRANEAFFDLEPAQSARFAPGDRVRTARAGHSGHTRLPAYARAAVGEIVAHHGGHVFPDASAEGEEVGHHLYTVRFAATELWGAGADARDSVLLDLWEPYLGPV